jgi:hypothetical protein
MHLMGTPILHFDDLRLLARYIRANRFENDPRQQFACAYERKGMGWNAIAECRFKCWERGVRLSGCDVFHTHSPRISTWKVAAYMLEMLPSVVEFIGSEDPLLTLLRFSEFVRLFFPRFDYQAVRDQHRLFRILAAMQTERGHAWAQQLKWFIALGDEGVAHRIRRSFNHRWEGNRT